MNGDLRPSFEDDDPLDDSDAPIPVRKKSTATSIAFAAMLGFGKVFQPEKTEVTIEQHNDDPIDKPDFEIDFGNLPPLN